MTEEQLEVIRRRFATERSEDIARDLGVCDRTVSKYAHRMGLEKDPRWWHPYRKGERPCTERAEKRRIEAIWEAAAEERKLEREGLPPKRGWRKMR